MSHKVISELRGAGGYPTTPKPFGIGSAMKNMHRINVECMPFELLNMLYIRDVVFPKNDQEKIGIFKI